MLLFMGVAAFGQNYSFKVKYGLIQAGKAKLVLTVKDGYLESRLNIESSPWLANLWTLSDSIWSFYEIESGQLKRHVKAIHEGSYQRHYEVIFKDSNQVSINGRERDLDTRGLLDIPSLLFELSNTEFTSGDTLHFRLWDGQGYGVLELLVEKISGPSLFRPFGEPGWKLTPLSSTKKSRENRIQLALMLSDTMPHTPLKIEIDTKYGAVVMRLITH